VNLWNLHLINARYCSLEGKRAHDKALVDHLRCVIAENPDEFNELKRLIDEAAKGAKQL